MFKLVELNSLMNKTPLQTTQLLQEYLEDLRLFERMDYLTQVIKKVQDEVYFIQNTYHTKVERFLYQRTREQGTQMNYEVAYEGLCDAQLCSIGFLITPERSDNCIITQ